MKQVTLCVPVYNSESTLSRTLETLVQQDYPALKIKIFDNASVDRSIDIARKFQEKFPFVEVITSDTNIGAEGNFSRCIQAAEGDYCALVHADDLYEKNYVSKSVEVLNRNPECVASFTRAIEIDGNENVIGMRFHPQEIINDEVAILSQNKLIRLISEYGNFITCPSVMVKSDIYRNYIKNWNGQKYKTSADLDVWLRLSQLGKIAAINAPLIKYRVAEASYSYRIAKVRTTRHDIFLVLDEFASKFAPYNENILFLELKDQALRCLNIFRSRQKTISFPADVKFRWSLVVRKMFHSKWHLKMGASIIGIHFLTTFLKVTNWAKKCTEK